MVGETLSAQSRRGRTSRGAAGNRRQSIICCRSIRIFYRTDECQELNRFRVRPVPKYVQRSTAACQHISMPCAGDALAADDGSSEGITQKPVFYGLVIFKNIRVVLPIYQIARNPSDRSL